MAPIKYDKHVKNLIAELNATKHVTHTRHRKLSVTFHHNGSVGLSHEAVLGIWKVRPASAHFDVDKNGDLAQYVEVDEYAWAVGNTQGNEETISIEMSNASVGPHWEVSPLTWKSGARLAGWLFAHVIKDAPTKQNVLLHHHWSATTCPGPFVDRIYDALLKDVQHWYHYFRTSLSKDERPVSEPAPRPHQRRNHKQSDVEKIQEIQRAVGVEDDGKWGKTTDLAVLTFRKKHLNRF